MRLKRTTLRLETDLKQAAELLAVKRGTTLQNILNRALEEYLHKTHQHKIKKLTLQSHDLGVDLDNLTRDDIYGNPKVDTE